MARPTHNLHRQKSDTPLVSVIMSAWNVAELVSYAIESILNQTFSDFEFIIIDDGSSDDSGRIIDDFAAMDDRIVSIHQKNTGLTKALNRGLKLAKGRYIARQDADDTSLPNRFETQLPWLENEGYDVCCSRSISAAKRRVIPRRMWLWLPRKLVLRYLNPHIHGSFIIRKKTLEAIGGYDESYAYAQDYKLIFDLYSRNAPIKYLMEPLYCTVQFKNSIKITKGREQKQAAKHAKQLFKRLRL